MDPRWTLDVYWYETVIYMAIGQNLEENKTELSQSLNWTWYTWNNLWLNWFKSAKETEIKSLIKSLMRLGVGSKAVEIETFRSHEIIYYVQEWSMEISVCWLWQSGPVLSEPYCLIAFTPIASPISAPLKNSYYMNDVLLSVSFLCARIN